MNANTRAMIALIQSLGYRTFMRRPSDEYCYYTDAAGERIGYAQWSREYIKVCSVHRPNRYVGTGYAVDGRLSNALEGALALRCPVWDQRHEREVSKWRNWSDFQKGSAFNAEFEEVMPCLSET